MPTITTELVLVITTLILTGLILWMIWAHTKIKGSVEKSKEQTELRRSRRMRAEVYVETFRGKNDHSNEGDKQP
jgi:hypothetical protein